MRVEDEWLADDAINRALGVELRALRGAISRRELVERLPFVLHIQTLQNYELGLRQPPLGKLESIARLLGTTAEALVGKAVRTAKSGQARFVDVDLCALRDSPYDESDVELAKLRAWARNRPAGPGGVAHLSWPVAQEIAAALGFSTGQLVKRLEEFRPK